MSLPQASSDKFRVRRSGSPLKLRAFRGRKGRPRGHRGFQRSTGPPRGKYHIFDARKIWLPPIAEDIPVGGHLRYFYDNWLSLVPDPWVLNPTRIQNRFFVNPFTKDGSNQTAPSKQTNYFREFNNRTPPEGSPGMSTLGRRRSGCLFSSFPSTKILGRLEDDLGFTFSKPLHQDEKFPNGEHPFS